MGRSGRGSIGKRNFGLTGKSNNRGREKSDDNYSNWFWESKSQKRLRENQKNAETERVRAETQAMQQLMSEQDNPNQGSNAGQVAMIGGLILLVAIGITIAVKQKGKKAAATDPAVTDLKAEDLIV